MLTQMPTAPPPVLAAAHVLAHATIDDTVVYTGKDELVVAGTLLGAVPTLAICEDFATATTLLLRCDLEWDVLGRDEHLSRADAEIAAELYYTGISRLWQPAPASRAAALAYYRIEHAEEFCSFCDRWPWQIAAWVSARDGVQICRDCVVRLHRQVHGDP